MLFTVRRRVKNDALNLVLYPTTIDTQDTRPIKIMRKLMMVHLIVIVKAKNKTMSIMRPTSKKYFLLSFDSIIGRPGISKDLLSTTSESDKARSKPPITDTFLKKNTGSKKSP
ncbi:hypothetical protein OGATHE_005283 [Ogataea polymorpha]|uniref:Uncharacterized protein n=1 Tax=Ogataea polymorpha TaxID=460523 RepID=A0A9P8T0T4_9ASCO|nr:hypothetical protein OGATHE_005283 [Ogataea polymorpha]